ncbi:MAG: glutamine amidotransferase [Pseudomonadota bacterium]
MAKRVVLITHSRDEHTARDDRASDQLKQLGFELDWRLPCEGDVLDTSTDNVAGTVVYGGKYCIADLPELPFLRAEIQWLEACMKAGLPVLGACQGAQMIAHILGAPVGPKADAGYEFGYYHVTPTAAGQGFMPDEGLYLTQAHFHEFQIPEGADHLARSERYDNQAFRYGDNVYGFQFHAEVTRPQFTRWQNGSWGRQMFDQPGAQTRQQQNALAEQHDTAMDMWFRQHINQLFSGHH